MRIIALFNYVYRCTSCCRCCYIAVRRDCKGCCLLACLLARRRTWGVFATSHSCERGRERNPFSTSSFLFVTPLSRERASKVVPRLQQQRRQQNFRDVAREGLYLDDDDARGSERRARASNFRGVLCAWNGMPA